MNVSNVPLDKLVELTNDRSVWRQMITKQFPATKTQTTVTATKALSVTDNKDKE